MSYDFDTPPDRRHTDSLKWCRYAERDVLPMWVADMDYSAPPPVLEAMRARIGHGVFGYAAPWPSLLEAVTSHLQRHYDWHVDPDWIVWIPGVVAAFNVACRATGEPGSAVFTSTPVYPPFLSAPRHSQRELVSVPLLQRGSEWQWDFAASAACLAAHRARLWLLCHPHNPVGRVWSDAELAQIAALAEEHDLVVCSDEIHCGLVLDPARRHQPLAALSPAIARRTITLMAPSKTFNIPGLYSAFAVIPDPGLRRRYLQAMDGIMPHVNTLGLVATEAAYRDCDDWQRELIAYLRSNAQRVLDAVSVMPGLRTTPVEATYLAWIDCRELCSARGIDNPQRFFEAAGVDLSDGRDFGLPGFVRLNFGCARGLLDEALARMARAVGAT